jgi:hypothetical protein
MKNRTKFTIYLFLCFVTPIMKGQVLFSEDFDSYTAGHLNTDYTNNTPGQGGWRVSKATNNPNGGAIVVAEAGKGNVLQMATTANTTLVQGVSFGQPPGNIVWNNRTAGNNILKFEYEVFTDGDCGTGGSVTGTNAFSSASFTGMTLRPTISKDIVALHQSNESGGTQTITMQNYNNTVFPFKMWLKVEVYVDYNTKDAYYYIPTLNLQKSAKFTHTKVPEGLAFVTSSMKSASIVKYDNIKLTAIQTLPSYILSNNEYLANKFNLFPNPAESVVNITNADNLYVESVTIYDISGKEIKKQAFANETNIQLNVENLASGAYMLHLQTNEGTAVKKLIKK